MESKIVLSFALAALEALPALLKLTGEAYYLVMETITSIKTMQAEGRDPTPEEWESLNSRIETLRAERDNIGEV